MRKKTVLAMCLITFLSAGSLLGGNPVTKDISFPPDDVELLIINADLGGGIFKIVPKEMDEILKGSIEYDPSSVEVYTEYEKEGYIGYIEIGNDLHRIHSIDTDDNIWDIALSTRYRIELTADLGACESDFDLGGIPVTYVDMDIGAADAILTFSKPNPEIAEVITIDVGAAKFAVENLGNANFNRFVFDGGVGKFELDFSGEYKRKCRAKISIGLGKAIIYLPRDLPVRIDAEDSFLSSVDFKGIDPREIEDGYYESSDFRSSDYGLELDIEVGFGSVDIVWTD